MMELLRENQENKKRQALAAVCAAVTVVAVCSLIVIASFIEMPAPARIALILLAVLTGAAGIGAASVLEAQAGYYVCPHCQAQFVPTLREYVNGYHTLTRRRLTCPVCGKTGMCRHRLTR